MTKKQSEAQRRRWAKVSKKKRSMIASRIAKIMWSKKTKEQKRKWALKMVKLRKNK